MLLSLVSTSSAITLAKVGEALVASGAFLTALQGVKDYIENHKE